jgi:hypothetical protein
MNGNSVLMTPHEGRHLPFLLTYPTLLKHEVSRILEKLTLSQLIKKFSAFCESANFVNVRTAAHQWILIELS